MKIGVLKEAENENRVALIPEDAAKLKEMGVEVNVESGAGERAFHADAAYEEAGASVGSREQVLTKTDMILSVSPPLTEDLAKIPEGKMLASLLDPLSNSELVQDLLDKNITALSLDAIPRSTRAQAMDVLSSMATVAGYKAVLLAAERLPKFFPMFMTAAGSIRPAKVLILGAGVAGLQAIATAKRLGAVVEAFDVRAAAKEEVMSLGAKFVEVEGATDDASAGGYAVEQTEEYKKKQAELIQEHAKQANVIICTAQIPGKTAPVLITKETVQQMKPGTVIVDLAASSGGNCEGTENNKTIQSGEVTIIGDSNLPSSMPADASQMFSKNIMNLLKILIVDAKLELNLEDEILKDTTITHNKEIINERVKGILTQTA